MVMDKKYGISILLIILFIYKGSANSSNPASLGLKGDTADVQTITHSGYLLMGGSTDVDVAVKWFLERSGGGDIVVLRASGSNAYNDYMFGLGKVNSVETLLINNPLLANNSLVAKTIRQAEGLFIAGGNQWNYIHLWNHSPVGDAINYLINIKKVPVGGTSASCAVLGGLSYDAHKGSITSTEALQNPYDTSLTLTKDFLHIPVLRNTITDSHYDTRKRQGRHVAFIARSYTDWSLVIRGIGVSEKTAVAVDKKNIATVFSKGDAYFLLPISKNGPPEQCETGKPLTWNKGGKAIKVYIVPGSLTGTASLDLATWENFTGGKEVFWSSVNGEFKEISF